MKDPILGDSSVTEAIHEIFAWPLICFLSSSFLMWTALLHSCWAGQGQWTRLRGPEGGTISTLALDPLDSNHIYAGAPGPGLLMSTDGALTWKLAEPPPGRAWSLFSLKSLAFNPMSPGALYAGLYGPGGDALVTISNGGESWTEVRFLGQPPVEIRAIAVDPNDPRYVYAGADKFVFRSLDGGITWEKAGSDLPRVSINAIVVDPFASEVLYAGGQDGVTPFGGIFRSADRGDSWVRVGPAAAVSALAADRSQPGTLYAGVAYYPGYVGEGVLKSVDGGRTWEAANRGLRGGTQVRALAVARSPSATIYAGTRDFGVFVSVNGGETWSSVGKGIPADVAITALQINASGSTVYAATLTRGLYKSVDSGQSWSTVNAGVLGPYVSTIVLDPVNSSRVYVGSVGAIYTSSDHGVAWDAQVSGVDTHSVITGVVVAGDKVLAGISGGPSRRYGILQSIDGGQTWQPAGLYQVTVLSVIRDPAVPETLYAATVGDGLFKSENGGKSWIEINNGVGPDATCETLAIDPQDSRVLYAGCRSYAAPHGRLLKTTTGGSRWISSDNGVPSGQEISRLVIDHFDPRVVYAGTTAIDYRERGYVLRSSDSGTSWERYDNGLPAVSGFVVVEADPNCPNGVYVAAANVVRRRRAGAPWEQVGSNQLPGAVTSLAFDRANPRRLLAGTSLGVFEIEQLETGCDDTRSCFGDCNLDGEVTVDEIVTAVGAALAGGVAGCPAADADGNNEVTVDEIVSMVGSALGGCGH